MYIHHALYTHYTLHTYSAAAPVSCTYIAVMCCVCVVGWVTHIVGESTHKDPVRDLHSTLNNRVTHSIWHGHLVISGDYVTMVANTTLDGTCKEVAWGEHELIQDSYLQAAHAQGAVTTFTSQLHTHTHTQDMSCNCRGIPLSVAVPAAAARAEQRRLKLFRFSSNETLKLHP